MDGEKNEQVPSDRDPSGDVSFDALPVECAALILSKLCPRDAGKLSCASKTWSAAAQDKEVWSKYLDLKSRYKDHFPELQEVSTGRDVFHALRRGVLSSSKGATCSGYMLSVDPTTGLLSLHISAFRCLYFYQRNDTMHDLDRLRVTPYGLWPNSAAGSTFQNSSALAAGLFHIRGELCPDFTLPAGTYGLSFKLAKPPPLHEDALFPTVCQVNLSGEPDSLLDVKINIHKDGVPSKAAFDKTEPSKELPEQQEEQPKEPEFWAKSPSIEREQDSAWETINTMFLKAYSYFNAEMAWKMQISGERVKPWKKRTETLQWEEFFIGELALKDEGDGQCALAIDLVLTDLESYTFQGPIWLDSVILTQVAASGK